VVAARVFVEDAGLAWNAAERFVNLPSLLRIVACVAMMGVGWALLRDGGSRLETGSRLALFSLGGVGLLAASSLAWIEPLRHALVEANRGNDTVLAATLAQRIQTGLSILWTLYAAATLATGFVRNLQSLRWAALGLFGLVITKVFLVDLSDLPGVYRVISFLVLGLVLLGVSYFYQRAARRPARS
jgi:uncharacterized membrane protein